MTLVNAYASLDEFLALPEAESQDPPDDVFIEDLLTRASRDGVDAYCEKWFYAFPHTYTYDMPHGTRELALDHPLLSLTTLTNGDGQVIPPANYILWPYNGVHYTHIRLRQNSVYIWLPGIAGDTEGVISVAGSWGYVDRTATTPQALQVISATKSACLSIALSVYKKRYGIGVDGVAKVTSAGVVITPQGIPTDAKQRLDSLRSML